MTCSFTVDRQNHHDERDVHNDERVLGSDDVLTAVRQPIQ